MYGINPRLVEWMKSSFHGMRIYLDPTLDWLPYLQSMGAQNKKRQIELQRCSNLLVTYNLKKLFHFDYIIQEAILGFLSFNESGMLQSYQIKS